MMIRPVTEIGIHRPPCGFTIRVAAGLKTNSARWGASRRRSAGIPIDQCGHRADFLVDGDPRCRAHAGQMALTFMLNQEKNDAP